MFMKKKKPQNPKVVCHWNKCNAGCKDVMELNDHVKEHLAKHSELVEVPEKGLECTWRSCDFKTNCPKQMERHLYYHGYYTSLLTQGRLVCQQNPEIPSCKAERNPNKIPELTHDFICEWTRCRWTSASIVEFQDHIVRHALFEHEMSKTPENEKPKLFECHWSTCRKSFDVKYRFMEHLQAHTNKKNLACFHCGDVFRTKTTLFDHLRRQPGNNTHRHQCAQCFKLFSTEKLLRYHVVKHVNCFKCSLCDMTCTSKSSLTTHIRFRHLKDRPFECPECQKRFVRQTDLTRHTEYLHIKKVHRCSEPGCNYSVRTYNYLRRHYLEVHADSPFIYLCHLCDKIFKSGRSLSAHLIKKHNIGLPSGHKRFTYRIDENGFYRLEVTRIESLEVTKQILSPRPETDTVTQDSSCCFEIVSMTNKNDERFIVSNDPVEAHLVGEVIVSLADMDSDSD